MLAVIVSVSSQVLGAGVDQQCCSSLILASGHHLLNNWNYLADDVVILFLCHMANMIRVFSIHRFSIGSVF
jgi:hypothetical protein